MTNKVSLQWRLRSQWKFAPDSDLKWTHYIWTDKDKARETIQALNRPHGTFEYRIKPEEKDVRG